MGHREPVGPQEQKDTSVEQQARDAAAAHNAWFRAESAQGMREADDPLTEWVSNEEVLRQSESLREEWLRKAEAKRTTD